jgi:hypothetical protein
MFEEKSSPYETKGRGLSLIDLMLSDILLPELDRLFQANQKPTNLNTKTNGKLTPPVIRLENSRPALGNK